MDFSINGSDSWETDAFQDKFIKDYFNSKSLGSSNQTYSEKNNTKKRKKDAQNSMSNGDKCAKRAKLNGAGNVLTKQGPAQGNKTKLSISDRLLKIANSRKEQNFSPQTHRQVTKQEYTFRNKYQNSKDVKPHGNHSIRPEINNMSKSATHKVQKMKNQNNRFEYPVANDHRKLQHTIKSKLNNSIASKPVKSQVEKGGPALPQKNKMNAFNRRPYSSFHGKNKSVSHFNEGNISVVESYWMPLKKSVVSNDLSTVLREKAQSTLQAAKFRILNQKMYTVSGNEAYQYFRENADAFTEYHCGYQQQVKKWPINPVDLIIASLRQQPNNRVIADLGCGDAKIARTLRKNTVHSFDLVALNEHVTRCDMSKVPLPNESVDIAVFCLSLMGLNLNDYLLQAFRILKSGGLLKIAEVESRIDDLQDFITSIEAYGFALANQDVSHKMFLLLDFHKIKKKKPKNSKLPAIKLQPCLYKKR